MRRKNRSGRWKVPPTGHKKGGGIQGIRTASAAGAKKLSDALGTRLGATAIRPGKSSKIRSWASEVRNLVANKKCQPMCFFRFY